VVELVDTHCHLDFNLFDKDREAVISRARDAGVVRILNPGVDLETSGRAVELAQDSTEVFAAIGVHPNDALSWNDGSRDALRALVRQPKVVAIGEIGLDYYHDDAPHDLQWRIFQEQLSLAKELGLPVIIHNRQATEDMLDILKSWCSDLLTCGSKLVSRPGVLHSFSADVRAAEKALELNFSLGITGPVTFKKAQILHQVVEFAPLASLLIETDAPFLTPHPHRGQRNEPAYVRLVAEKITEIRNLTLEKITKQLMINSEKLFNW
jgi:TatD DNase family protein